MLLVEILFIDAEKPEEILLYAEDYDELPAEWKDKGVARGTRIVAVWRTRYATGRIHGVNI